MSGSSGTLLTSQKWAHDVHSHPREVIFQTCHTSTVEPFLQTKYQGDKSQFIVVHTRKDMQVMIITIAWLTQKNVTVAQST